MRIHWNDSPARSTAITTDGSPGKLIADFRKHIRNYWRCSRIEFSACTIKSLHIRVDTILLIERGTHKVEVKTAYKRQASMSDVTSPEPNVRNDSTPASSTLSVAQEQDSGKGNAADKVAMKRGSADWIAAHPFHYDKEKSVEANSAEATRIAKACRKEFGETCEINTPARIALRRRIIEELYGNGAEKKERKAFIVIGLPASGKSSAVAERLARKYGALIIDSDEAKERLPEFTDGLLADAVHKESSKIAERVRSNAIENGDNIVLTLVGKTESKLRNLISALKNNGYEVNLHYVDLPVDKAMERGRARFAETGRNVPLDYIRSVGLKPKHNFDKLKAAKEVDSYGEWSNDVDRGQRPRLLEERPAGLYVESELAGRGQRVLHEDGKDEENSEQNQKAQGRRKDSADKITSKENRSENQDGFSVPGSSSLGEPVHGIKGAETTVVTDSGKEIRVRYLVVPAARVITSHDAETMAPNKAYP